MAAAWENGRTVGDRSRFAHEAETALHCKEDFLKWNNVVLNPLVIMKPL